MRVILIGFGTVGQHFAKALYSKAAAFAATYGFQPRIVAVADRGGAAVNPDGLNIDAVLESKRSSGSVSSKARFGIPGKSALEVVQGVDAEVVVEVTPTNTIDGEPGLSHVRAALSSGKHAITTNKGPIALALPDLLKLASKNNVCIKFSGTVGGGIPILDLAKKRIASYGIRSVRGVLNTTTNYILTRMAENRVSMEVALKEARAAGYAEADPFHDINGFDTACKLVILANWVMERKTSIRDVKTTGIAAITLEEIERADRQKATVRLIGTIEKELVVQPERVSKDDPLSVKGAMNAVTFDTDLAGGITLVGFGAGGEGTSRAVLRDLIDIAAGGVDA